MALSDRRYGGGSSRGNFSGGGFFGWSFPLFTVPGAVPLLGGIRVRVHILYILIAASEILGAMRDDGIGLSFTIAMMGSLFVLVLLHEFGHCAACRWVGGDADHVLMWPLGGLAFCRPPHRWKAALATTVGGPGVNVVLMPILAGALMLAGAAWDDLLFNPLRPQKVLGHVFFATDWWRAWLWAAHYMNFVLFAFNVLVPMYPMDSGRIVQEILWWRVGYHRSMVLAVNVGLAAAVVLGIIGSTTDNTRLIAVAIFGGITCFTERQRIRMMGEMEPWSYDTDRGMEGLQESTGATRADRKSYAAALKKQEEARRTQAEVDRILAKISDKGMQSLTRREAAFLREATERQRGG